MRIMDLATENQPHEHLRGGEGPLASRLRLPCYFQPGTPRDVAKRVHEDDSLGDAVTHSRAVQTRSNAHDCGGHSGAGLSGSCGRVAAKASGFAIDIFRPTGRPWVRGLRRVTARGPTSRRRVLVCIGQICAQRPARSIRIKRASCATNIVAVQGVTALARPELECALRDAVSDAQHRANNTCAA